MKHDWRQDYDAASLMGIPYIWICVNCETRISDYWMKNLESGLHPQKILPDCQEQIVKNILAL